MPELIWNGKYDDNGQIVGPSRVSLPFQTVETVNQSAQERQMALTAARSGATEWRNRLIWGDKKYVLPSLLKEFAGKVDLIYIDPPFATGANFGYKTRIHSENTNISMGAGGGRRRNSGPELEYQPNLIEEIAYRDTWGGGLDTYLKWMHETLTLLRELLTESGSIYVHCDWRASHYIKTTMDDIWGYGNFRNEITWERIKGAGKTSQHTNRSFGRSSDCLLFYSSTETYSFNPEAVAMPYPKVEEDFPYSDSKGPYKRRSPFRPPGLGPRPNLCYEYRGVFPPNESGWTVSESRLKELDAEDELEWAAPSTVWRKQRPGPGILPNSIWTDFQLSNNSERLGYPTQKPEALLERIIKASSNEGDLVLDCFIGSGTTAAVAEKLGRRWIAADMGRFAVSTTRKRLLDIPGVKPFHVQNLGRYERQAWQSDDLEHPYRELILQLYRAEPVSGYQWLHGARAGRMIHVGAVDAPVALNDVQRVVDEFVGMTGSGESAPTIRGVDILGWDFGLEVDTEARELAENAGVSIRLLRIPREVMDRRAVDAGDIRFFELAALSIETNVEQGKREVELALDDFTMPLGDVPNSVREKVTHWSQWIDYWAVDWDYRDDTFNNQWQSYRTNAEPRLSLTARHGYKEAGAYAIVVKVIDILGNDTTRRLEVNI